MQTLGLSESTPKTTPRFSEVFNPDLSSIPSAESACRAAAMACFVIAFFTTVVAVLNNPMGLLDAALFVLIGFGLRKGLRTAAVAGLALYVVEILFALLAMHRSPGVLTIFVLAILINGVRASFAYQRMRQEERQIAADEPPPLPEGF